MATKPSSPVTDGSTTAPAKPDLRSLKKDRPTLKDVSSSDDVSGVAVPAGDAVDDDRIDLVWKDVVVSSKMGRALLDHVSGSISGGLVAIMGPSGSGKTTLLNCLACRMDTDVSITGGSVRVNGEIPTTSTLKKFLGYVMQDDQHTPLLTSRETLTLAADTRLSSLPTEERVAVVNKLLEQMSLSHIADVQVGTGRSGIGAGEKKRLSVAMELLTKPKMLFLDEPTSNLDSLDALLFVQSMRRLVDETKCVVVCTIHQPQFKVFQLFDRLIMLRSGQIVYDDAVAKVQEYCASMGDPCPPDANPADHLMAFVAPNFNDSFRTESKKRAIFMLHYDIPDVDTDAGRHRRATYLRVTASMKDLVWSGFQRSRLLLARRSSEWRINLIINIVNAVLFGTVFLRIGQNTASMEKRLPAVFFAVVNQGTFGAISTINLLPSERTVVLRQRAAGNMTAFSYFFTKVASEMLWKLPFPIIFSCISYFLVGFQEDAAHFFRFLACIVLTFLTGMAAALAVASVSRIGDVASLALPLVMEVSRLFAGFFAPPSLQLAAYSWIDYLSYYFYGFFAAAHNELDDLVLRDCVSVAINGTSTEVCTTTPGSRTLVDRQMNLTYGEAMGYLVLYMFVCLTIAYIGVRFLKS